MSTPEILHKAIRQYRHNYGGDDLVMAFDKDIVIDIVTNLEKERDELEAQNADYDELGLKYQALLIERDEIKEKLDKVACLFDGEEWDEGDTDDYYFNKLNAILKEGE